MSGDVMRTLAEARPAELHPDAPVDGATRRAELARAMAAAPGRAGAGRVPRRRFRSGWGLGLTAAATATAAVVAVVAVSGGPGGSGGSGGSGGPVAGGAPDGEVGNVRLDARTVLLAAAEQADRQTDRVQDFWHTRTIDRRYYRVGPAGDRYTIVTMGSSEGWTPSGSGGAPGGKQWSRMQDLGARPAGPADRAAWQRAGSPGTFEVTIPGKRTKAKFSTEPGKPSLSGSKPPGGDEVFWLGRNVTVKQLRALPSDPKSLKAELLHWYGGHDTEASSVPMKSGDWLLSVATGLVNGHLPVTPKVRAGAFRMLAGLGSVRAIGKVRDAEGRTGTAIAATEKSPRGVVEHRLIIDPATGNALAEEFVLVEPRGDAAAPPVGSLLGSSTVVAMEWTDSRPA